MESTILTMIRLAQPSAKVGGIFKEFTWKRTITTTITTDATKRTPSINVSKSRRTNASRRQLTVSYSTLRPTCWNGLVPNGLHPGYNQQFVPTSLLVVRQNISSIPTLLTYHPTQHHQQLVQQKCHYFSLAHARPKPLFSVPGALERVLKEISQRKDKRSLQWKLFRQARAIKRGKKVRL